MRSVPPSVLLGLLLAMCGLCGVQWWRESQLRDLSVTLRQDLSSATAERDQLNARVKAADAEILRLNAAFNELRANSAPKADLEAAIEATAKLKAQVVTANEALARQNDALQQQTAAIQKANDIIKKTASERDDLARKVNEITVQYNALLKKQGGN